MKRPGSQDLGEWVLLNAEPPGRPPQPIGVLLVTASGELHIKLRTDWSTIAADEIEVAIWQELTHELQQKAKDKSGRWVLDWLEDTASHVLQAGSRQQLQIRDPDTALNTLYSAHIEAPQRMQNAEPRPSALASLQAACALAGLIPRFNLRRYNRWVYPALATILLVIAVQTLQRTHTDLPRALESIPGPNMLPLTSESEYDLLPQLDYTPHHRAAPRRQRVKARYHPATLHKRFKLVSLSFRPPIWQSIYVAPPPLFAYPEMAAVAFLPFPLPEAPQFRPRHGPLMQLICVVTLPFRILFSHHPQQSNSL